jgi:peptide/nickel transport system permease protein
MRPGRPSAARGSAGSSWAASCPRTFPGLGIMLTVLGMNLLGDGLRDVLDPRLQV